MQEALRYTRLVLEKGKPTYTYRIEAFRIRGKRREQKVNK